MEHHQDIAGAHPATKEVLRAHQVTAGAVRQATAGAVRQATAEVHRADLQVTAEAHHLEDHRLEVIEDNTQDKIIV